MKRIFAILVMLSMLFGSLTLPVRAGPRVQSYVIMAATEQLPPGLADAITKAGGSLVRALPEVGLALASSSNPNFASTIARLRGIQSVFPNFTIQMAPPASEEDPTFIPLSEGGNFSTLQWSHKATNVAKAWAAGLRGQGVRVVLFDTGIDIHHPDLLPNLNTELSLNLIDWEELDSGPHGTHTAGIIAAADDGWGVTGVAPEAEIVMVKVCDYYGFCDFFAIMTAFIYAADIQADVVNMSLAGFIPRHRLCWNPEDPKDCLGAQVIEDFLTAFRRATNYAYQHGVTLVASAGNDGLDMDHDRDNILLPGGVENVIVVSATGPNRFGEDQNVYLDNIAPWSNYGQSSIDLAAPGGNQDENRWQDPYNTFCTVGDVTRPCTVFDGVLSTVNDGWAFWDGTSMSAPYVSGVAALIIGQNGGSMPPAQVYAALIRAAEDLGKPGNDDYFGHGRVNAGNIVP